MLHDECVPVGGGSPSAAATVMVVLFLVGISTEIHVGSGTAQGCYLEN